MAVLGERWAATAHGECFSTAGRRRRWRWPSSGPHCCHATARSGARDPPPTGRPDHPQPTDGTRRAQVDHRHVGLPWRARARGSRGLPPTRRGVPSDADRSGPAARPGGRARSAPRCGRSAPPVSRSGLLDQDGELERQLALLLDEAGLRPAWGMEVLPGIVVDACFPDALYVIECDGRLWHRIDADRAADATRQGVLEADGWRVDRVRHEDLTGDRVAVLARVRATRAARAAAGLRRPDGWRPVRAGRRVRPPNFGADVDAAGAVGGG